MIDRRDIDLTSNRSGTDADDLDGSRRLANHRCCWYGNVSSRTVRGGDKALRRTGQGNMRGIGFPRIINDAELVVGSGQIVPAVNECLSPVWANNHNAGRSEERRV